MEQVTDKRQAILDATLRLISQNGFHGASMSQVAEEAKVSTGIIYHYFESKDELIDELYKSINRKSACVIRAMPITDSGACRSLIPGHADH